MCAKIVSNANAVYMFVLCRLILFCSSNSASSFEISNQESQMEHEEQWNEIKQQIKQQADELKQTLQQMVGNNITTAGK